MSQGRDTAAEYQAWLVDLDGTLYYQNALQVAMALELALVGWSAISCIQAFREEHERMRRESTEPLADPYRVQIERTAARLGRPAEDVRQVVAQWMIARPCRWLRPFRRRGLLRDIAGFHGRGGKTALVSDYPAQAKLEAMGIAHLFDVVIASGESAAPLRLKPWPDGYMQAAETLRILPRNCLVIGDRNDADGQAARQAGMAFRQV